MRHYIKGTWIYRLTEILAWSSLKTSEETEIINDMLFLMTSTQLPKLAETIQKVVYQTVKYRFIVTFNDASRFEFHLKLIESIN